MRTQALMYHDIAPEGDRRGGFSGDGPDVYAVAAGRFRDQLDRIATAGCGPPAAAVELLAAEPPASPWLITFDDGGASAVAAGDELASRGWRGNFFIVTDFVGTPGFVSWEDVRALSDQGHTIGSHSCSHPDRISSCGADQLRHEWSLSAERLTDATGSPTLAGSVPGGYYSPAVGAAAAAAGIRVLFTSRPARAASVADGCLLVGRYAVRRETTVEAAAGAAAGGIRPWARQRSAWEARAVAKKATGRHYRRIRAALLARG